MTKPVRMTDKQWIVMARLVSSANPLLCRTTFKASGKVGYDLNLFRDTIKVDARTAEFLIKNEWVACHPINQSVDTYIEAWNYHATEKGREITLAVLKIRFAEYIEEVGEKPEWNDIYEYGKELADTFHMFNLIENPVSLGKVCGDINHYGKTFLETGVPVVGTMSFEEHWKERINPTPEPPKPVLTEEQKEAARKAWDERMAVHWEGVRKERQAEIDQQEREKRGIPAAEKEVVRLAKAAFQQQASFDDLMLAVERLLRLED
jgi:hypothetical protein